MSMGTTRSIDRELLVRLLSESVGLEEDADLAGDDADTPLVELGYDSLALLHVAGRIEADFGLILPDDAVTEDSTLASLLESLQRAERAEGPL
jgi:act minimal PKS acyl carrier protein